MLIQTQESISAGVAMHHKTQKLEFSRYTGWPKEKVVQGWPWGGEGQRSCTHLTILQANQESLAAWGVIGRDTYLPVLQADQEPLSTSRSADDLYVPNQGLHQPLFLFNSLEGEALKSFVLLDWKKTTHLINAICPITCLNTVELLYLEPRYPEYFGYVEASWKSLSWRIYTWISRTLGYLETFSWHHRVCDNQVWLCLQFINDYFLRYKCLKIYYVYTSN